MKKRGHLPRFHISPQSYGYITLSKKVHFLCNFVLTSARNLGLLKQFTYIHLKSLVTHFREMVLFILL